MATSKQLDDLTECPICTEVYTDPRSLPCVHTYCLKCLETYCKDKQPGDELACPLCRKEFTLPSNGVRDLPKNFHVASLLQMKELSGGKSKTKCKKHVEKDVDLYCLECSMAVCTLCYVDDHNGHKCSDAFAGKCRQQMMKDYDHVAAGVEKCREMLQRIKKEKNHFQQKIKEREKEIYEKVEMLKQMIDDHKEKLTNELSSMDQQRMKEIESLREAIETQLMSMKSYMECVDEVRQKGTACDIARAASDLHDRSDELLKFDVIERMLADLGHADVTFTSSDYIPGDVSNTLGKLRLDKRKSGTVCAVLMERSCFTFM